MKRRLPLLTLCLGALVSSMGAGAATPVITGLKYSPKPLYDDDSSVVVSFKASRPARPGYEYGIFLNIFGKFEIGSCSSLAFSWDRKFGGNPNQHMRSAGKHIRLILGTRYGYWCRGRASINVVEHKIGSDAIGRHLGETSKIDFRVLGAP